MQFHRRAEDLVQGLHNPRKVICLATQGDDVGRLRHRQRVSRVAGHTHVLGEVHARFASDSLVGRAQHDRSKRVGEQSPIADTEGSARHRSR